MSDPEALRAEIQYFVDQALEGEMSREQATENALMRALDYSEGDKCNIQYNDAGRLEMKWEGDRGFTKIDKALAQQTCDDGNALIDLGATINEALTPPCCHVSGEHNPTHFKEGTYVCTLQKADAFDNARRLLGLEEVKPEDAKSKDDCGWCHGWNKNDNKD